MIEKNTMTWPGVESGPLDLESSALTTPPPPNISGGGREGDYETVKERELAWMSKTFKNNYFLYKMYNLEIEAMMTSQHSAQWEVTTPMNKW